MLLLAFFPVTPGVELCLFHFVGVQLPPPPPPPPLLTEIVFLWLNGLIEPLPGIACTDFLYDEMLLLLDIMLF